MALEDNKITCNKSFSQLLDDFQEKTDQVLINYVKEGYLKTLARVISYISKDKQEKVLFSFDQDTRQHLEYFMNSSDYAYMEVKNAFASMDFYPLEEILQIEMKRRGENNPEKIAINDGKLEDFTKNNPVYGYYLQKVHIDLAVILMLHDHAIQKILREIDTDTLAMALVDADIRIVDKIKLNMSDRAWKSLEEDIEQYRRERLSYSRIISARAHILSVIKRLEDYGEIVFHYDDINKASDEDSLKINLIKIIEADLNESLDDDF